MVGSQESDIQLPAISSNSLLVRFALQSVGSDLLQASDADLQHRLHIF